MGSRQVSMGSLSIAATEADRVEALRRLGLLDTADDRRFDRLVELASAVLETPIALISLVDQDRQWFKARVGLETRETPRDVAFCAHAIAQTDAGPFVVPDALLDARFATNPLVVGDPGIRFYAGQVIHDLDGHALGTLCVIDRRPRQLTAVQRRVLEQLAALVEDEVQRRTEWELVRELDIKERNTALMVDSLAEGVVLQDTDGRIIEWNRAAEQLLGLSADQLGGRSSYDERWRAVHADGTAWSGDSHPAIVTLRTGQAVAGAVMGVHRPDGTQVWLRVNAQPVTDAAGSTSGVLAVFADITAEHVERRLLDATLAAAPVGLAIVDGGHAVIRCNASFAEHLGQPVADLMGGDIRTMLAPSGRAEDGTAALVAEAAEQDGAVRRRIVRPDGTCVTVAVRSATVPDDRELSVVATADVTNDHRDRLLLDAVLETAPVGIAILDEHRRILRCNGTFADQTGRPAHELTGIDPATLLHADDRAAAIARRRPLTAGFSTDPPIDVRMVRPDGTQRILAISTSLLAYPVPVIVASSVDITEREHLTRRLAHQATHDPLTGLANRALFATELARSLARGQRDGHRIAVCYLDLDRFKQINDTYGHGRGDQILTTFGTHLTGAVRAGDVAARLGGDEFAIILDRVQGPDEAQAIAARVRDSLATVDPDLGVSIGVALDLPGDTAATILARADQAQYQAKSTRSSAIHLATTGP